MSTPDPQSPHDPYRRPTERKPIGTWEVLGLILAVGLGIAGLAVVAFFVLAFLSLGNSSSNK